VAGKIGRHNAEHHHQCIDHIEVALLDRQADHGARPIAPNELIFLKGCERHKQQ
jgi:hypothetical protein